jgi:magnesium-protoporphyrin O-methyltransferase
VSGCDGHCCFDDAFGEGDAKADLRRFRTKGATGTTRLLIDGLAAGDVTGLSILDIGAGVGAVHLELLARGATTAVDVDASRAYIEAARGEADRRGVSDRVRHVKADFVAVADQLEPADLVALDRVVCCYADMPALLGRAAALTRRRLGLVYPRDTWLFRAGVALAAGWFRLTRSEFRPYAHRTAAVEAVVTGAGLRSRERQTGWIWQTVIYERP